MELALGPFVSVLTSIGLLKDSWSSHSLCCQLRTSFPGSSASLLSSLGQSDNVVIVCFEHIVKRLVYSHRPINFNDIEKIEM